MKEYHWYSILSLAGRSLAEKGPTTINALLKILFDILEIHMRNIIIIWGDKDFNERRYIWPLGRLSYA